MKPRNLESRLIDCAILALLDEATLHPKPGLVDPFDNGSHQDMNYELFVRSAHCLTKSFCAYYECGKLHQGNPKSLMNSIRPIGIEAEAIMFETTHHINTHKGANFLFGIVLAAIGYGKFPSITELIEIIKAMTHNMVYEELECIIQTQTFGEQIYLKYGITGIRGEVASGLRSITHGSLPILNQATKPYEHRLKEALIQLIKNNDDTNMVKRGGIYGLSLGKRLASFPTMDINSKLRSMNNIFKYYNLSPGGSADLLSLSAFLYNYSRLLSSEPLEYLPLIKPL